MPGGDEPSSSGTLRFPDDVVHRQLDDETARRLFRPPIALGFEGATAVRVGGRRLVYDFWVTNPTPEDFPLVVWPYGGSFPYGGDNPLTLGFSREAQQVVNYSGEAFPPEPPLPMEIVIPANGRVHFSAEIDLSRYSYDGCPEVSLEWGFHLLEGESPSGAVLVELPRRPGLAGSGD
jgi:hypothetical protein